MIRKRPDMAKRPSKSSKTRGAASGTRGAGRKKAAEAAQEEEADESRLPPEEEAEAAEAAAPPARKGKKAAAKGAKAGKGTRARKAAKASEPTDGAEGEAEAETPEAGDPAPAAEPAPIPDPGAAHLDELALRVEALLFASGQALPTRRLAKALAVGVEEVNDALEQLQAAWAARTTALELVEVSGGWRLMTRPAHHDDVARLAGKVRTEKLSPAALETLAVVAYRQPIGRADIESIRGVQCGPLLRVLLDRDLIRITGRSSEPGHPLLYGTTKQFLDHFGLKSLKNLPDIKDLLNAP